ncbi:hypothetical protein [Exiguobacterium sp. s196]|uniref:hypothetical protein n=1 Tax=Exiguobacterium sp. s196 TaxID=2751283 RepID=UPI001BE7B7A4|nr:hypothetical protein [Exiguobacterium sp. s196]
MSNPSYYKIEINGKCFNEDISCTGEQLESILQAINEIQTDSLIWYLFDIFGGSKVSLFELFPSNDFGIINFFSTYELIGRVKHIIQFESGVFIGSKFKNIEIDFENQPHSEAELEFQLNQTSIEIRAFDFECFEIILQDEMIYHYLKNKFL